MNFVIFLFVFTLFLFFLGCYALSADHNPKVKQIMDDAEAKRNGKRVTREHAFSEENIKIYASVFNGIAILLSTGLVCWVPFFRIVAAVAMLVYVVRFFYRRHTGGARTNFVPVSHTPNWGSPNAPPVGADGPDDLAARGVPTRSCGMERRVGNHSESDDQEEDRYNGA
jgi:hypothetical protein